MRRRVRPAVRKSGGHPRLDTAVVPSPGGSETAYRRG
jgi:hypothetical protein